MKKIAVVGSRDYPHLDEVRQFVFEQERTTCIVSGGARGVDRAALDEAARLGMPVENYLPDWTRYGRSAGYRRNEEIVAAADEVVAFWDGVSKGTKHTIDLATRAGKPVRIFGGPCPPRF